MSLWCHCGVTVVVDRYLPGVPLPENVVANPSLADTVSGASLLVFVLPHQVGVVAPRSTSRLASPFLAQQFLPRLLPTIKQNMSEGAVAISLIKVGVAPLGVPMRLRVRTRIPWGS